MERTERNSRWVQLVMHLKMGRRHLALCLSVYILLLGDDQGHSVCPYISIGSFPITPPLAVKLSRKSEISEVQVPNDKIMGCAKFGAVRAASR